MDRGLWHCIGDRDQDHPQGAKKCKKAKWLSEDTLQIAVKRRESKSKGEKERYTHLNAEFQRIAGEIRKPSSVISVLEKEMATHSSVLAWRIPRTGEPGGPPSMGSYRVGHDWSDLAAAASLFHCHQCAHSGYFAHGRGQVLVIWIRYLCESVLKWDTYISSLAGILKTEDIPSKRDRFKNESHLVI